MRTELPAVDMVPSAGAGASYRHSCPLCNQTAKTESDLYTHLQVCHQKSRVCSELLNRVSQEPDRETPAHGE
jgi:hypothetical protein